jgi:hypothetical protein
MAQQHAQRNNTKCHKNYQLTPNWTPTTWPLIYLTNEEYAYDSTGDYKQAHLWLANKLTNECDKYASKTRKKKN